MINHNFIEYIFYKYIAQLYTKLQKWLTVTIFYNNIIHNFRAFKVQKVNICKAITPN